MRTKSNWSLYSAVAALSLAAAGQASANNISAVVGTSNFSFTTATATVPNTTSGAFSNSANQRFIVTFSSECAVNAPAGNTAAWVDVDIVVLNTANAVVATLPPTVGTADAFCSANGTAGFDGWATHSVTAVGGADLPAGTYKVQVRARLNNGATGGWFGERALLVNR